jgi:hypothetical protein
MDSLNTSCGKVSDEMSFSKSSDFRDKPVSSVFIKRKISFSDPCLPQLVFKESMIETIGSVTIETNPSDMNYKPPKGLQAQSKYRAIKPAIQNKYGNGSNGFYHGLF